MKYSHNDEEIYIKSLIDNLNLENTNFVDIGASDGLSMSNSRMMVEQGCPGLCIEPDVKKFDVLKKISKSYEKIKCYNGFARPDTIVSILEENGVNKNFTFLNLDIDGYEYFVLDKLLESFRPSIICVEINEKIPPPIKFTVLYSKDYFWDTTHFYGCSLEKLAELCEKYNYALVNLEYNNAFLINNDIPHKYKSLTATEAYRLGYANRVDRKEKFYYNDDVECLQSLTPIEGIRFINDIFSKHKGRYEIGL